MSCFEDIGDRTQVEENLVRHVGGTIYLRTKVQGKVIRVSLETSDLRIAKNKRPDRLAGLPQTAMKKSSDTTVHTLSDAMPDESTRQLKRSPRTPPCKPPATPCTATLERLPEDTF